MAGRKAIEPTPEQPGIGIEEKFLRLEQINAQMEQEGITLAESFRLFQEGMGLVKQCADQLKDVEKQMIILEEEHPL